MRLAPMGLSLRPVGKLLSVRSPTLSIGKDKLNDAVVADAQISRQHCVLELDSKRGAVFPVDFSPNGPFLNGRGLPNKKHGKVLLSPGDELCFKDPGPDAEFGYMVNLFVDGPTAQGAGEGGGLFFGREFAGPLRRRRQIAAP
eukprot:UN3441